jgi:hypothetical protein
MAALCRGAATWGCCILLFMRVSFSTFEECGKTYGNVLVGSGCGAKKSVGKIVKKGMKNTVF